MEKTQARASVTGALAIFAKTKSLSPVKTRLAADIGKPLAEAFYTFCVAAVTEVVESAQKQSQNDFVPYWALAEEEAVDYKAWQGFHSLWTGEDDLGMRLHRIYNTLRKKHDYVVLLGTDSPQLEPELITSACKKLAQQPERCVIGPALDGGFYLFAAKIPIKRQIWTEVSYSQSQTLAELRSNLAAHGISVELLPLQTDVDTIHDLKPLSHALKTNGNLLPAQQRLQAWLEEVGDI